MCQYIQIHLFFYVESFCSLIESQNYLHLFEPVSNTKQLRKWVSALWQKKKLADDHTRIEKKAKLKNKTENWKNEKQDFDFSQDGDHWNGGAWCVSLSAASLNVLRWRRRWLWSDSDLSQMIMRLWFSSVQVNHVSHLLHVCCILLLWKGKNGIFWALSDLWIWPTWVKFGKGSHFKIYMQYIYTRWGGGKAQGNGSRKCKQQPCEKDASDVFSHFLSM